MKNLIVILRRELGAYFNSAIATIFLIVFLMFTNGVFMLGFLQIGRADMRSLFNSLPFVLTIFISAISMRLWAEEKKGNTFELLLTFPMKPWELVLGKYLSSLLFYTFALVTTLTVPLMLYAVGKPDLGGIVGGYFGALLLGALFLAIGIFISGLCKDQIVAFILTVVSTFALFFIGTDIFAAIVDGWVAGLGTFIKTHLGVTTHLLSFGKGVINLKDVIYFTVMIFMLLLLNGLSLEGRFRPKAKLVFSGAVAVCVVIAVIFNWLLHDTSLGRVDLTEGQTYTVSEVSGKILKRLKVPIQIKLYISPSDSMPSLLKTLERDLVDKLEELRVVSDNKFRYRVIHLEPGQSEDDAEKKVLRDEGVIPFQVESIQRDEVGVKLIYSTLVIEYKEKTKEILPRLVPQSVQDLEYQLLSRIYKMTLEEKPKVAFYAPLTEEAYSADMDKVLNPADPKNAKNYEDDFKTALLLLRNNGYEASRIRLTQEDPIPDNSRILILLNPGPLTDEQRTKIGQYLQNGGTVFLAAQGFQFSFRRREQGLEAVPEKMDLSINQLIEKWGLKISHEVLLDENSQIISIVSGQSIGPYAMQMPVKFLNQIIVDEAFINRSTSITNRLPSIAYLWGSAIVIFQDTLKKNSLKETILFTSSPRSWKISNDGTTSLTHENTKPPAGKLEGKFPLAVMLEGKFGDAEAKPGRLVVVGCSSAFSEDLIQNPGNINLFANIVDGFALSEDLVQIRSKTGVVRDIRRLSNTEKIWYKFFTILLVPLVLLCFAGIRLFLRKKEKEFYLAAISNKAE